LFNGGYIEKINGKGAGLDLALTSLHPVEKNPFSFWLSPPKSVVVALGLQVKAQKKSKCLSKSDEIQELCKEMGCLKWLWLTYPVIFC